MKYLSLIYIISVLGCNSSLKETKVNDGDRKRGQCFVYPHLVDSLQIKDLYDSARWFIYTWHCDLSYIPKADSLRRKTFGELELRFNSATRNNDTVDIDFNFIDNGKPVLFGTVLGIKGIDSGVRFNYRSRRKIAMLSHGGYSMSITGSTSRYENALQPEVISYIKNNWDKLDYCFRELAKQKGIAECP